MCGRIPRPDPIQKQSVGNGRSIIPAEQMLLPSGAKTVLPPHLPVPSTAAVPLARMIGARIKAMIGAMRGAGRPSKEKNTPNDK